jgi:hypothetical protein
MITEVTIYEKNDKMYCPACKPQGGKRGTFGTSEYDHFCAGCGEDLKEIGEAELHINDIVTVDLYGERLGKVVSLHDPGDGYGLSVEVELDTPWRGGKRYWFEAKEIYKETIA